MDIDDYTKKIQAAAERLIKEKGSKSVNPNSFDSLKLIADYLNTSEEKFAFGIIIYNALNKLEHEAERQKVADWLKALPDKEKSFKIFGDFVIFDIVGSSLYQISPELFRGFAQANPVSYLMGKNSRIDNGLPKDIEIDPLILQEELRNYHHSSMAKTLGYPLSLFRLTNNPETIKHLIANVPDTPSGRRDVLNYYLDARDRNNPEHDARLLSHFKKMSGYSETPPASLPVGTANVDVYFLERFGPQIIGKKASDEFLLSMARADPLMGLQMAARGYPSDPRSIPFYQAALPRSSELYGNPEHARALITMLNKLEPSQYADLEGSGTRVVPEKDAFRLLDGATSAQLFNLATLKPQENNYPYYQGTYNEIIRRLDEQLRKERKSFSDLAHSVEGGREKLEQLIDNAHIYNGFKTLIAISKPEDHLAFANATMKKPEKEHAYNISRIILFIEALPKGSTALGMMESMILSKAASGDLYTKADMGVVANWYANNRPTDISAEHRALFESIGKDSSLSVKPLKSLPSSNLLDAQGRNYQLHVFYNDQDGIDTFRSFSATLKSAGYQERKQGDFLIFSKKQNGREIQMLVSPPEQDGAAVKGIQDYVANQNGHLSVVIARGHSHHMVKAIDFIDKNARIVTLGGCWGQQYVRDVLDRSPEAHIIATNGVGRMSINNANMRWLNEQILSGKDINWADLRKTWERMGGDRTLSTDVKQYVAPDQNLFLLYERKRDELYRQIDTQGNNPNPALLGSMRGIQPAAPPVQAVTTSFAPTPDRLDYAM